MITKLRKRATLVMVIVLVAFVGLVVFQWGADVTRTGGFRNRKNTDENVLAEVGGVEITRQQYAFSIDSVAQDLERGQIEKMTSGQKSQLVQTAWQHAVNRAVWQSVITREQITMSPEEFQEILMQIPPVELMQDTYFFKDGQFDFEKYWELLSNPDPPPIVQRLISIHAARLMDEIPRDKIRTDVRNGFTLTGNQIAQAQDYAGTAMSVEALFVFELPPVDSNVSESEIQAYYKEHIDNYEREKWWELRTLIFPIVPSPTDTAMLREHIEDVKAALSEGYPYEQIALDFTGDSSMFITLPVDNLDAVEFENLSSLEPGEIGEPFFTRGAWHFPKMEGRTPDSIKFRDILFRLEYGKETLDSVLLSIEEMRKRAKNEQIDSLVAEFGGYTRGGPYVRVERDLKMANFPYTETVETFARNSRVGDISEPFPVFTGKIYLFATIDITKNETLSLDSSTLDYTRNRIIRERAEKAQWDYAQSLRSMVAQGVPFSEIVTTGPHLSIDTLNFRSYFEAETRYSAYLAGACYTLQPGDLIGPVKWNDSKYPAYFRCLAKNFDPASPNIATGIENEYNALLNALTGEVFSNKNMKDYRTIRNFGGGG